MSWQWDQSAGELRLNGALVSRGYSGKDRGKNNPALQGVPGIGPIPAGAWKIVERYDSANVGPYALVLHAVDATPRDDRHDPTGRGAFRIHGDSIRAPGTASKGCIILPRAVRERIWTSGDRDLQVVVIKRALDWISGTRDWLTLLAVAGACAFLYVKYETMRRDRDALASWGREVCAHAGRPIDAATVPIVTIDGKNVRVKKPRGQWCVEAIADLAAFRRDTDAQSVALLTRALEDHDRKSTSDLAAATRDAASARAAAERMEKADAQILPDDRVDGRWFAALNDVAGLGPAADRLHAPAR